MARKFNRLPIGTKVTVEYQNGRWVTGGHPKGTTGVIHDIEEHDDHIAYSIIADGSGALWWHDDECVAPTDNFIRVSEIYPRIQDD